MNDFLAQPILLASALNAIELYEPLEESFCNVAEKQ